jgi:hypothetical protein
MQLKKKGDVMTNPKKIDDLLEVGDKIRELEEGDTSDDDKRKRQNERKNAIKKINAEIAALKNNDDEKFVQESLREIATIGLSSMRVLQGEIEEDPSGRAVECMAAITNAVTNAVKQIQNRDIDERKIRVEEEKLTIKKNIALPGGTGTTNVLMIGSMKEVLGAMRDGEFENEDEIQEYLEEENYRNSGKGSPFKKD